ncbi:MAG: NAD(P)-dependent oxidoreductase [Phycisphaeraceae bacterium]
MAGVVVQWEMSGLDCLVIGAGPTGRRRAALMTDLGAHVTVVAPDANPSDLPASVTVFNRLAAPADLHGRHLVILATDNPDTQHSLMQAAQALRIPVNRADDGDAGDLTFLATRSAGPLTLSVSTAGASASAAVTIAEEALAAVAPDWTALLEKAAAERDRIQQQIPPGPARQQILRQLVNEDSRAAARESDQALRDHWDQLISQAQTSATTQKPKP